MTDRVWAYLYASAHMFADGYPEPHRWATLGAMWSSLSAAEQSAVDRAIYHDELTP